MDHRTLGALAIGGILATGVAGCGGGSGSNGLLSRPALAARANSICQTAITAAKAVPQPSSLQNAKAVAAYFDGVAPIISTETSNLQALKPDRAVRSDWNAYVALRASTNSTIQQIRHKADAKDPSGLTDLKSLGGRSARLRAAATKVGAGTCAR